MAEETYGELMARAGGREEFEKLVLECSAAMDIEHELRLRKPINLRR